MYIICIVINVLCRDQMYQGKMLFWRCLIVCSGAPELGNLSMLVKPSNNGIFYLNLLGK